MAPDPQRLALLEAVRTGTIRGVANHSALASWPELQALRKTPQDKEWHAEGDVLTHTDMVLAEAPVAESELLSKEECETLRLSCLFHDISKPFTTRFDQEVGHVIAPGHERMGGVKTRYLLHETKLPGAQRRMISELVATHHLVKRSVKRFDQPDGPAYLDRLAARVDTRLLWALELADMRGRIAVDRDQQIEMVRLFRMLCEERGIFGAPPAPWISNEDLESLPFDNAFTARWAQRECYRRQLLGALSNPDHARAFCYEHAKHKPAHIVLNIGIAGSGKSRAAMALEANGFERISPDNEREDRYGDAGEQGDPREIHGACMDKLRSVLRVGGRAIYDATNVIPDLRSRLLSLCYDYRAFVEFYVFDVSLQTAFERNRGRERHVPEAVIQRHADKFEWPLPEEAHTLKIFE